MRMGSRARKLALTAHIAVSVGWLGTVTGVLGLAIAGLASDDPQTVRAAYIAMDLSGWLVLVPLAVASLVTGVVQSLGTKWGLLRYYWVIAKLVINLVATIVLLMYTQTLDHLAGVAAETSGPDLSVLQTPSVVLHAGAAVVLLLVATALAVFKPRGMTRYGWRKQRAL